MIDFRLNKVDLIKRKLPVGLVVNEVTDENIIEGCIKAFKSEVKWNGMFSVSDAMKRIKNGDRFFVGKYDGNIFGYCWLKRAYKDSSEIYNVFSKKTDSPRLYGATDLLYSVIENNTSGVILAKLDDWNIRSIHVFEKLGFKMIG